jgi:hypothetical protein
MKKRKLESVGDSAALSSGRKRPDISKKKQEEKYFDRHVIKCTLGPFSKFKVVTDEIQSCVYWMSRLMVHTSHVMTLLVLDKNGSIPLEIEDKKKNDTETKNIGIYGLYNKVMRTVANFLQGVEREADPDILRVCEEYAQATGIECGSWGKGRLSGWRGKVLDQMAKQMATSHTTHIETNLFIYAMRFLRYLVRTAPEEESIRQLSTKNAYNKVFSAISDAFWTHLSKKTPDNIEDVISRRPSTLKVLPLDHAVWPVAQNLLDRMREFVPKETTLSQKSEIMFRIMSELEPFSIELQRRFVEGIERPCGELRWGKSNWTFCLCPQTEWRPKHVHITSTAIIQLLKDLSKKHPHLKTILDDLNARVVVSGEASHDANYEVWSSLFNMRRVLRPKHLKDRSHLRFGNFIASDGVSVSVCVMKKKSPIRCNMVDINNAISALNKSLKTADSSSVPTIERGLEELKAEKKRLAKLVKEMDDQYVITDRVKELAGLQKMEDGSIVSTNRVVGLDPGKKSAATWVVHDPVKQAKHQKWKGDRGEKTVIEERYESDSLGGGEWRFMSGQKQYTAKMNKRMDTLCPSVRNLPSTKTIDVDRLRGAYRQQVALWPDIERSFFETTWFQKTRMRKFCKAQRAMEDVIARITGTRNKEEQTKVVIAYGDGDNQGTLRGTSPIMSSKLLNKVSQSACVVTINEFRTSKLCSCCHQELTSFRGQFRMKRCDNSDCIRTVWDRDINASINILNLFLQACLSNDGKFRAAAFRRKRGCDE